MIHPDKKDINQLKIYESRHMEMGKQEGCV